MVRDLPRRATRGIKRETSPEPIGTAPARKKRGINVKPVETPSEADVVEAEASPAPAPAPEPVAAILPHKVTSDQPLPVVDRPQSTTISNKGYQSIAESGVLALSLERSRHVWLHNCIFDRFWSKAHYKKKKDAEAEGKSQGGFGLQKGSAKPPMTKIGDCRLTVEPHVFDVTLFIVKDTTQPPVQQSAPTQPKFVQYGGTKTASPAPQPSLVKAQSTQSTQSSNPTNSYHMSRPVSLDPLRSFNLGSSSMFKPETSVHSQDARTLGHNRPVTRPPAVPAAPITHSSSVNAITTPNAPTSTVSKQTPTSVGPNKPDPVIAILAERAQKSKELKEIMQIVATGEASTIQLSIFQSHITEITAIVERRKRQEEAAAAVARARVVMSSSPALSVSTQNATVPPMHTSKSAIFGTVQTVKTSMPSLSTFNSSLPPLQRPAQPPPSSSITMHHPQSQTPRYTPQPVPVRKPTIAALHVLLEFGQNSVDRFLFPTYSILDFSSNYQSCLCSFLVLRTASQSANPSRYTDENAARRKPEKGNNRKSTLKTEAAKTPTEYYQCVTVGFSCTDPNVLGYLAKVVKPQDEVRRYMEEVMRRGKRAEDIHLPLRLPRKKTGVGGDEIAVAA